MSNLEFGAILICMIAGLVLGLLIIHRARSYAAIIFGVVLGLVVVFTCCTTVSSFFAFDEAKSKHDLTITPCTDVRK